MEYSQANAALWNPIIQLGIIAILILVANVLRRKLPFIRKTLMPTAVLAGFLMLIIRQTGLIGMDTDFLEMLTYHALGIGFIALTLRVPTKGSASGGLIGSKSGALIVSTYLVQALTGLVISIGLAFTVMPDLFKASGILLPMAYGQGPGQANNIGSTYEALGMTGGRSFGLSLAAAGYLCACIVGVIFLNIYDRRGKIKHYDVRNELSGSVTIDTFQDHDEIPISESIDKLSIQVALIAAVYLLTYLFTWGITALLGLISPGVASTVSTLLWGFNFILGSLVAMIVRRSFKLFRSVKLMNRQYQNNYLLSRISGLAFDYMIVAGIASINISDLKGYLLPFILMAVAGGIVTFIYLKVMCKKVYPDYPFEGFFSMYGMLTGTISSGVLLLREVDPELKTPAANNLVTGSSFGILFGAPVLLLVSMAAKGNTMLFITFGIIIVYLALLLLYINFVGRKRSAKAKGEQ
ncbi:MAG: sodium:glutamate symporter [Firmicutes bacterium]|nr:sodium:glutamate symporter [Bacillota bacterium]